MSGIDPGLWLSLLVGCIYGSVAHLVWGRRWVQLPLFVLMGIVGCVLMWLSGVHIVPSLPAPGGLPLLEGSAVAWLLLGSVAVLQRA